MKKIFALILALAVLAAACMVYAESAANAFASYDARGYSHDVVSLSGDLEGMTLQSYFNSPDKTDCVLCEAALTDEECAELEALDFFAEDYWDRVWAFAAALPADRVTVTSLNDGIPTEEAMSRYAGKTVETLMDDGYEWYTEDEDEAGNKIEVFHNEETGVLYAVTLAGDPEPEDLSDEAIGGQVIESVRFWGFDD